MAARYHNEYVDHVGRRYRVAFSPAERPMIVIRQKQIRGGAFVDTMAAVKIDGVMGERIVRKARAALAARRRSSQEEG